MIIIIIISATQMVKSRQIAWTFMEFYTGHMIALSPCVYPDSCYAHVFNPLFSFALKLETIQGLV